ncbi:MAG: hypothetical protein WC969_15260 [Elusimicrobiota bacterium]|jgi:hypothetical protein
MLVRAYSDGLGALPKTGPSRTVSTSRTTPASTPAAASQTTVQSGGEKARAQAQQTRTTATADAKGGSGRRVVAARTPAKASEKTPMQTSAQKRTTIRKNGGQSPLQQFDDEKKRETRSKKQDPKPGVSVKEASIARELKTTTTDTTQPADKPPPPKRRDRPPASRGARFFSPHLNAWLVWDGEDYRFEDGRPLSRFDWMQVSMDSGPPPGGAPPSTNPPPGTPPPTLETPPLVLPVTPASPPLVPPVEAPPGTPPVVVQAPPTSPPLVQAPPTTQLITPSSPGPSSSLPSVLPAYSDTSQPQLTQKTPAEKFDTSTERLVTEEPKGLSNGAKVMIGVGVTVVAVTIEELIRRAWKKRSRRR